MRFISTTIPDVICIEPKIHGDHRGFFMETYHVEKFAAAGITERFIQDNHSRSIGGTLRGLHYQNPRPQGKLVRCLIGEIYDIAVDLRRSSPSFGKWVGVILSQENMHQLWIPSGFAHGFVVRSKVAEIAYKCTDLYAPESEHTIRWDDPSLAIDWQVTDLSSLVISNRDLAGTKFTEARYFD